MQQLVLFLSKYRTLLLFLALLAIAVVRHNTKNPAASHVINAAGTGVSAQFLDAVSGWKSYWRLDEINQELARENAALRAGQYRNAHPDFTQVDGYTYLPAKVIEFTSRKRNNYIIIDAGRKNGISEGAGIIAPSGWVGIVSEVSSSYAYVTPLLHTKGGIGARIPGKGLGELHWEGTAGTAILTDIQRENKPTVGDSVYSYTRAVVAPPSLAGTVRSVSQNKEDLTWKAEVELSTQFEDLNWVYICDFYEAAALDSLNVPTE